MHLGTLKRIAIATAVVGLGGRPALANTEHDALRQVGHMLLEIAPLDADSETCGVTRGRIAEAIRGATADAPFTMDGESYILLVRVSSLPKDGNCFSSIDMGVYYRGVIGLPAHPDGAGRAVLWENGTILISPRSQHWAEVENIILHLARGLVADWRGDNAGSG